MDADKLIEVIKTLNLNSDINLNSQTLSEIASVVSPYITYWFIYQAVMNVVGCVTTIVCVYLLSKAVMAFWKHRSKND